MVDDAGILAVLEGRRGSLDAAARDLVGAANRSGGEDNITVVCFELGADGDTEPVPESADEDEDTLDGTVPVPLEAPAPATKASRTPTWLIALPFLLVVAGLVLWVIAR